MFDSRWWVGRQLTSSNPFSITTPKPERGSDGHGINDVFVLFGCLNIRLSPNDRLIPPHSERVRVPPHLLFVITNNSWMTHGL